MQFWLRDLGFPIWVRLDRTTLLRFDTFMDLMVEHQKVKFLSDAI